MKYLSLALLLIGMGPAGVAAQGSVTIASGATATVGSGAFVTTTGHWTNNGTLAGTGTVVFNGGDNQLLTHTGTGAFYNLTVNKTGGDLLLQSSIALDGTLTLSSGDLDLNGYVIDLGTGSGTVSETAGNTVKGTSGTLTARRLLNAPGGVNVAGLGAILTSSANLDSTTVTRGHTAQTDGTSQGILRYFDITPTNNTGLNATLAFSYDDSELNGHAELDLRLFRSTDGGTTWTEQGGVPDDTGNTVTLSGLDAFSRWTLAGVGQLPVELVSFEAQVDGLAVALHWHTASETNNAGFDIETQETISNPAAPWHVLGFVAGHGTTADPQAYSYRVETLAPGHHRFRLKQIDFDGTYEYSPEIETLIAVPGTYRLSSVFPNPFNPGTGFTLAVARKQRVRIAVFDVQGRRVAYLHDGLLEPHTTHRFVFEPTGLPSGVYGIRVIGEDFTALRHAVLLK